VGIGRRVAELWDFCGACRSPWLAGPTWATGTQVPRESPVRGIESGMKQLEYIYRVDVVPIGGALAVDT
jgi:hypothetical protein